MRGFAKVAEIGGFAGAAARLDISPSMVRLTLRGRLRLFCDTNIARFAVNAIHPHLIGGVSPQRCSSANQSISLSRNSCTLALSCRPCG
jgi:hypothetical protein